MTDAALDLSSKSTATVAINGFTRHQFSPEIPLSSKRLNPHLSTSSSSSDDDSDSAIRSVVGPIPSTTILDTPGSSSTVVPNTDEHSLPSSPSTPTSASVSRHFYDYPVESVASAYSSPSSALMAGHIGALTSPLSVGLGLSSNFPHFPLTSHLFQRKRRKESRYSGPDNSDNDSRKLFKNIPEEKKDNSYWERRRKNNEAAKRSRDNRRQKEEEVAIRAAYLEQENLQLQAQVAMLKAESTNLHYMLFNRR